jgi:hypothetical protein
VNLFVVQDEKKRKRDGPYSQPTASALCVNRNTMHHLSLILYGRCSRIDCFLGDDMTRA